MLFQEPPPDTSGYLILGYTVAFIVIGLYIFSLYIRSRNLKQDMDMLADLESTAAIEEKPKKKTAKPVTKKSRKK